MTSSHNLVVLTSQTPHDAGEALSGPLTALRRAVRDEGGLWATAQDVAAPGESTQARARPSTPTAADRQASDAIWPTYHDAVQPPAFQPEWQVTHQDRNARSAQTMARLCAPGAAAWIIGHELQLAPAILRAHRPDLRVGFYLPIPFPPLELFMRLPSRDDILRGLLGADFIGLQTRRDVDNLLRAAQHLLGVTADGTTLVHADRLTSVAAVPTSVDVDDIALRASNPTSAAHGHDLRAQLGTPRLLILSVDPLDHTAGIEHRLHAFEHLLAERYLHNGHAIVVQIAVPPSHRAHADENLRHRVEQLVARINGDHGKVGRPAVHYLYRPVSGADLIALYRAADMLLATPLRDGMNLTAKQYVASRADDSGAVILSEFSGAAAELRAAHLVNPYDLDDLKTTIRYAATEPAHRATHRIKTMRQHLRQHNAQSWAAHLLSTLDHSSAANDHAANSLIPARASAPRSADGSPDDRQAGIQLTCDAAGPL